MAKDVRWIQVCDPCNQLDIPNAEAVTTHLVSIDGGPLKEVDVCARDEEIFQQFLRDFVEGAREVPRPETEPAPAVKKRKPKAVKTVEPKQLEKPPDENSAPPKPRQVIWCPLEHPTEGGAGKAISYADRNSHADQVHDHARLWEIPWGDPENILHFPCDAHAECMKIGLSFATSRGLAQHRGACPLPRIDQEGDPQKADEPAP